MPLQRRRRVTAYLSDEEYRKWFLPFAAKLRRAGSNFSAWLRAQLAQGDAADASPVSFKKEPPK